MFGAMNEAPLPDSSVPRVALRWQWSRLPELAPAELYAVLAARQQVFTVEQHCAFQDADGYDFAAWHLLGWTTSGEEAALAAYLRSREPDETINYSILVYHLTDAEVAPQVKTASFSIAIAAGSSGRGGRPASIASAPWTRSATMAEAYLSMGVIAASVTPSSVQR